jgi:hypothetical protein
MRQHIWVLWYVLTAIAAGCALALIQFPPRAHGAAVGFSLLATIFLFSYRYFPISFQVTSINANTPNFAKVGEFAARLPSNAAFLVDEHMRLENKLVEFATDRSSYPATEQNWPKLAHELEQAGALPYLLTPASVPLPVAFVDTDNQRTIYACTPAAESAAAIH